jgi:hypothetical protein
LIFPPDLRHNACVARQPELELSILALVPPGTGTDAVCALAERLDAAEHLRGLPVTWSVPSLGLLDQPAVIEALRPRLLDGDDRIASAGYTGVTHSLLLAAELEPECALGISNEEGSGLLDLFPEAERVLLAPFPDPRRPEAASVYAAHFHTFTRGIVPASGKDPAQILCAVGGHTWALPTVLCPGGGTAETVASALRTLLRQRRPAATLIVQAGAEDAATVFESAMESLAGAGRMPGCVPFHPDWVTRHGERTAATPAATETGACRLAGVRTSETVNELRGRSPAEPAAVLRAIAAERATARFEAPCDGSPPAGRTIHASMMGTATLQMDGCEVQFSRGRLSRFGGRIDGKRAQLLADTATGRLRTAERNYELTPESAFSFEDGAAGARGLMAILSFGRDAFEAPGRLLIDYTAVGEFPWLLVDLCFEFPVLGSGEQATELIPFALPLRLPDRTDAQTITTEYPDGSGSRLDLHGMSGSGCAFGSLIRLGGRLSVSCLSPEPGITGAFQFEIRRGLSGTVLTLFPVGRFGPEAVAERAGTASRVRFALAVGRHDYAEITGAPPEVLSHHVPSAR